MKYIVIVWTFIVLHSCSESQCENEPFIESTRNSVTLWVGETYQLALNTDIESNDYMLESDNPEIASAQFTDDNKAIYIKTFNEGTVSIRLINIKNDQVVAEIFVIILYFGSERIEETYLHPNKSEVFVKAQDAEVQKKIEDELWSEIKQRKFSNYTFDGRTKNFTMNIPQLGVSYKGIYEWDINSLTLKYDNIIEKYGFKIAIGRNGYIIQANKTNKYQALYPKADITAAIINRVWHDCYILNNVGGLHP